MGRWTVFLGISACGESDAPAPDVTYDSAGVSVTILSARALSEAPEWALAPEPSLAIGGRGAPGAHELSGVTSALRLSSGRVVIANAMTSELRGYDERGGDRFTAGGAGEGPGEFRFLLELHRVAGDSILAWDVVLRRISLFTADGTFVRSSPVPTVAGSAGSLRAALADGSMLFAPEDRYRERDLNRVRRDTLPLVRLDPGTGETHEIARFAGQEQYELSVPPVQLLEPSPFGTETFVAAVGDRVALADNARPEIQVLDARGELRRLIRLGLGGRQVERSDIAAFERANVDESWRPSYLAAKRQYLAEVPYQGRMPYFGALKADDRGRYWIGEYQPPHEEATHERRWWIVGADGSPMGRVVTPAGLRVLDIAGDHLLGVRQDELGVEEVVAYELRPAIVQ